MNRPSISVIRISGIDSIRFLCAIWVFFGHGAWPPVTEYLDRASFVGLVLTGLYKNIWAGPAAVIIFFVISGFCIHFPYANSGARPLLVSFYLRRFLRLLIPVAIAMPLSTAAGVELKLFHHSILWSLLAELIYYIIYPALLLLRLRFGSWLPLLVGAYGAALAVILTDPLAGNYPSYGASMNWIVGLPCWLLGCGIAEMVRNGSSVTVSAFSIWRWRSVIMVAAWMSSALRFHSPIGYPWTLSAFAILAAAWLRREIIYRQHVPPTRALEMAGLWSYSLYLMHGIAGAWFGSVFPHIENHWLRWFALCGWVGAVCYLFYRIVEKPSHVVARKASQRYQFTVPEPSKGQHHLSYADPRAVAVLANDESQVSIK